MLESIDLTRCSFLRDDPIDINLWTNDNHSRVRHLLVRLDRHAPLKQNIVPATIRFFSAFYRSGPEDSGLPSMSPALLRRLQKEHLESPNVIFINLLTLKKSLHACKKQRCDQKKKLADNFQWPGIWSHRFLSAISRITVSKLKSVASIWVAYKIVEFCLTGGYSMNNRIELRTTGVTQFY